jgi:hypothetical protein
MDSRHRKLQKVGMDQYLHENAECSQKWRDNNPDKVKENNSKKINSYKLQYGIYLRSAELRQHEFAISLDEYKSIVKNPCHYCGVIQTRGIEEFNGIDRKNNVIGYTTDNCVSCCKMCNYMKNTLSVEVFVNRIEHILSYNNHGNSSLFPDLFGDHNCTYCKYKSRAVTKKIDFSITESDFNELTNKRCYICGKQTTNTHTNGIDRYDSALGYTIENCRTCCGECNYMKREYSYIDVFDKFRKIHEHYNKQQNDVTQEQLKDERIIQKRKRGEPVMTELDDEEYEKKNDEKITECIKIKRVKKTESGSIISSENTSLSKGNRKTKEERKEESRMKTQRKREELRRKLGDKEYKKQHAEKIAECRKIKRSTITETETETETETIILSENTLLSKGNRKTEEERKEESRMKTQRKREALRRKLGDEEYKKQHAEKIAQHRERNRNKKLSETLN